MSFSSLQFLAALLLISTFFFYIPRREWRQVLLAACNAAFLAALIPNVFSFIVLTAFLLSGYALGRLLIRRPSNMLLATYLFVLVTAFVIIRKYDLVTAYLPQSFVTHSVSIVGLSYMLFRQ